jgi:hypothetical protein
MGYEVGVWSFWAVLGGFDSGELGGSDRFPVGGEFGKLNISGPTDDHIYHWLYNLAQFSAV